MYFLSKARPTGLFSLSFLSTRARCVMQHLTLILLYDRSNTSTTFFPVSKSFSCPDMCWKIFLVIIDKLCNYVKYNWKQKNNFFVKHKHLNLKWQSSPFHCWRWNFLKDPWAIIKDKNPIKTVYKLFITSSAVEHPTPSWLRTSWWKFFLSKKKQQGCIFFHLLVYSYL